MLKQLGKTDGHFLLALEETKGAKIKGITFDVVKGPEAAAERVAEWVQGGNKQVKRSFQFVARLEATDSGKTLAKQNDGDADQLRGASGREWYFADLPQDVIHGNTKGLFINEADTPVGHPGKGKGLGGNSGKGNGKK